MKWMDDAYAEASILAGNDVKWKDFPKWIKFRIRLMNIIWDWLSWDAVKSGWRMPRLQFKMWRFYKKHPYLKRQL